MICLSAESTFGQVQTVYKIQVASLPQEYSISRVTRDLGISDKIVMHFIEGRYKYFVGSFESRQAANAYLPNIDVRGAWVVPVEITLSQADTDALKATQKPVKNIEEDQAVVKTEAVTEMVFRIQIAADRNFIDPARIGAEKNLKDYDIDFYYNKGWWKYNVGDFPTRAEAESYMSNQNIAGWVVLAPVKRLPEDQVRVQQAVILPGDSIVLETGRDSARFVRLRDSARLSRLISGKREDYLILVSRADSAFSVGNFNVARDYYTRAKYVDPSEDHPKDRLAEINKLGREEERTRQFSGRVRFLYIAGFSLLGIMILVLIITLTYRTIRKKRQARTEILKDEIQDSITEYLFDEEAGRPEKIEQIKTPHDKQVLIDEVMQLYANLSGEISNKLRELYIDLGLDNESVTKTQSNQWHIRAKGFRELAQMNIKTVNDEIEKCLNSDNDILRMEAQLAMIRLNYEDPFSFLDKLQKPFTSWEQLHVYEMITRHQINVPDFIEWLSSPNHTIVIFCIRMIRAFKQSSAYKKLIPFLEHSNKDIREETVITLGELRVVETLPILKERFIAEEQETKVLILQAMSKMPEEENIEFLQEILEPSNALRLQAAEALSRIESFGVKGIETILRRSDDDLQAVAKHILDSKTR